MKKLLTGFAVLALGVGVLAGCTERSDRVTERERITPSPSASPDTRTDSTTRSESTTTTTTPPPAPPAASSESSATSSSPSTAPGSSTSSSSSSTK